MKFDAVQQRRSLIAAKDVTNSVVARRDYTPHEVKSAMSRMGGLMPMNIFLRQEIGRMQKVITLFHQFYN